MSEDNLNQSFQCGQVINYDDSLGISGLNQSSELNQQVMNYDDSLGIVDGASFNNSDVINSTQHPEPESFPKIGSLLTVSCPQCNHVFETKTDEQPINGKIELKLVNF